MEVDDVSIIIHGDQRVSAIELDKQEIRLGNGSAFGISICDVRIEGNSCMSR